MTSFKSNFRSYERGRVVRKRRGKEMSLATGHDPGVEFQPNEDVLTGHKQVNIATPSSSRNIKARVKGLVNTPVDKVEFEEVAEPCRIIRQSGEQGQHKRKWFGEEVVESAKKPKAAARTPINVKLINSGQRSSSSRKVTHGLRNSSYSSFSRASSASYFDPFGLTSGAPADATFSDELRENPTFLLSSPMSPFVPPARTESLVSPLPSYKSTMLQVTKESDCDWVKSLPVDADAAESSGEFLEEYAVDLPSPITPFVPPTRAGSRRRPGALTIDDVSVVVWPLSSCKKSLTKSPVNTGFVVRVSSPMSPFVPPAKTTSGILVAEQVEVDKPVAVLSILSQLINEFDLDSVGSSSDDVEEAETNMEDEALILSSPLSPFIPPRKAFVRLAGSRSDNRYRHMPVLSASDMEGILNLTYLGILLIVLEDSIRENGNHVFNRRQSLLFPAAKKSKLSVEPFRCRVRKMLLVCNSHLRNNVDVSSSVVLPKLFLCKNNIMPTQYDPVGQERLMKDISSFDVDDSGINLPEGEGDASDNPLALINRHSLAFP
ncbi:hypothetical protein V1514DRAFT_345035 [Lipomyces japonicus]|uniref:uncharacterized protein n=1 Tax=Lipomyces japonicus TaxID=56871 RepID=UPI0034CFEBD2